ncbi:MAG: hypothetical protein JO040_03300 [Gemmatimonadetes bacterium]|nr:hypothetical protein [Gemmatimonadota bacterium]
MSIRIDAEDLLIALEIHDPETDHYLDLQTGEVILAAWSAFDRDEPEYAGFEAMREDPRYRLVEPVTSGEEWRWMRDFAEDSDDPRLKERLLDAIHGSGAFGRFKRVLSSTPEARDAWFRFREERLLEHARDWLRYEGIEAELADLPARRPDLHPVE